MKRFILLTLLYLLSSLSSFGQSFLYPVKIDHKWGYINRGGKIVIEPQFDIINFTELIKPNTSGKVPQKSNYRLVQVNKKVGIINAQNEWVIPAQYKRIHLISDEYFAVAEENRLNTVDTQNIIFFEAEYKQIRYLGRSSYSGRAYFKVRNDSLWGVQEAFGKLILPMSCHEINFIDAGEGLFQVKEKSLLRLLNRQEQMVLPEKQSAVKACAHHLIAYIPFDEHSWLLADTLGKILTPITWKYVEPLNAHWLAVKKDTTVLAFSIEKQDTVRLNFPFHHLEALDEKYVKYQQNNRFGFMDKDGKAVSTCQFYDVIPFMDNYYAVLGIGGWGLYDVSVGRQVIPFKYRQILPFTGNYAFVRSEMGLGIINRQFNEIIPPLYDTIYVNGNVFKAHSGLELNIYEVSDAGAVVNLQQHTQVASVTIKKRTLVDYVNAEPLSSAKYSYETKYYPEIYFSPQQPTWSKWQRNKLGKLYFVHRQDSIVENTDAGRLVFIEQYRLGVISKRNTYVKPDANPLMKLFPTSPYRTIALHNHATGEQLGEMPFIGIRRHDFERGLPCAAVMDTNGWMTLIDTLGRKIQVDGKPFTAIYIGEFENGWARYFVGGNPRIFDETKDNDKYIVENILEFWKKMAFDLTPEKNIFGEIPITEPKAASWLVEYTEENSAQWGYIHVSGKYKIPAHYNFAKDMKSGQAEVMKNGDWGVIDTANQIIIPIEYAYVTPYYDYWRVNKRHQNNIIFKMDGHQVSYNSYQVVSPFKNGFSRVKSIKGWGLINEAGEEIVLAMYKNVGNYSEGLIAVEDEQCWSFINDKGEVIIPHTLLASKQKFGDFVEGKCWFTKDGKYGYIDNTGKIIIPPQFQLALDFQQGIARIVKNGKTGLIDAQGNYLVLPDRFDRIEPFDYLGFARVIDDYRTELKGILRKDGKLIVPPQYQFISEFQEGKAVVSDGKKYGFINTSGKLIIPIVYSVVQPFSEGVAIVKKDYEGNWQYIDSLGNPLFHRSFGIAHPFKSGIAFVQLVSDKLETKHILTIKGVLKPTNALFYSEGVFGAYTEQAPHYKKHNYYYSDEDGYNIWSQYFLTIHPFQGEYAMVEQFFRKAIINQSGLFTLPPKYIAVERLDENHLKILPPAFGIMDRNGKIILPPIFDRITMYSGNLYQVEQGERIGYMDLKGKWIWQLQN